MKQVVELDFTKYHSAMDYYCKYCGISNASLTNLTAASCPRHPLGPNKGHHEPAL